MQAALLNLLGQIHPVLRNLSGIPLAVFLLVVALTALFTLGYLVKGTQVAWQLASISWRIRKLHLQSKNVDPKAVAALMKKEPFRHLWEEYSDSLHTVRKASNQANALTEVRATQPAELFFSRDVLVDGRLFDEFTRHLPGVLTGLGIIGTFAGLLEGLSRFDATSSATAVAGLKPLLDGVAHAFSASAIAIACAMFITFTSRFSLAMCYRLVEKLNHAIDALYATGAGEEYLARLVHSSERSEAHTAQLKQALVEDLTKLMTNLTERQIEAQAQSHQALGNSIADTLAAPLKQMTEAMQTTSQGNGQAVSNMLDSLLTGFMAKLEDTFGGQMRGIHETMQRSMGAMATVQHALQKLIDDMNQSSEQAATRMSTTLEEAMKQAAAHQGVLTDQIREFVAEFRKLLADEQGKSQKAMDDAVAKVLAQLTSAIEQMEATRRTAASQEQSRSDKLENRTQELVGGLSGQVEQLVKSVSEIGAVSLQAVEGMNKGALQMEAAAARFQTAGNSVSSVFERSGSLAEQLVSTANVLQGAAAAVRQGFEQYDSTRKTVDANVTALTGLIENVRREAGLSKAMLGDLERIVAQLRAAETQSTQYLQGVNDTLSTAFQRFGDSMLGQLTKTIGETDKHLSSGVAQLNGVVQEIGASLSRLKRLQ